MNNQLPFDFDSVHYKSLYNDLVHLTNEEAEKHYLNHGIIEKRLYKINDDFNPSVYRNIYKELQNEFPDRNYMFNSGNLEKWFKKEKIFLLNASLSVIKNKPASQMDIWEEFTNDVIKFISENNKTCVFVLLGNFAKSKQNFISNKSNKIIFYKQYLLVFERTNINIY